MSEEPTEEKQSSLKQIGQMLREHREQKGYTLSYVTDLTRINIGVLKSIEEGEVKKEPGPVFIRGFIRTYAKLVGIDEHEIQELLNETLELQGKKSNKHSESMGLIGNSDEKRWMKPVSVAVLIVIIVVGYWFYQTPKPSSSSDSTVETGEEYPPEKSEPAEPSVPEAAAEPVEPSAEETAGVVAIEVDSSSEVESVEAPVVTVVPGVEDEKKEANPDAYHLMLSVKASELVWLGINVDDESAKEILLQPGEQAEWKAKDHYRLNISNTKNVEVQLNGRTLKIDKSTDLLTNWGITRSLLE